MAIVRGRRGNRGRHDKVAPIPGRVRAVAMHAAQIQQAAMETKPQLHEDFLAAGLDFGRVRALSTQI